MAKGTIKKGHISHKTGRLFVPGIKHPTPLFTVGRIAYTVGQRCVRKYNGSTYAVCIVKGKGMYTKVAEINNSAITNRMRYAYNKGA